MKHIKILAIFIVSLLVILSWYLFINDNMQSNTHVEKNDEITIKDLNFTIENYPRVDGSTSTHPLGVITACKILNISYNWKKDWWDGTIRTIPNASEPEKEYITENISKMVVHHGTHDAYVNLINGTADLILVARLPSEDELNLAESLEVELKARPIALDAFVFVLNKTNPINNITIEEIQGIYTGNIINWTEVGGVEADINPYRRDENSGSEELMKTLVMKDLKMMDAQELILYGMMGPINRLSWDVNGIGYSVYYFEEFMAPNERIKLCGVNGIFPNYENIKSKSYPFTTEVYAVIRSEQVENSNANLLLDWLLSQEGQAVIDESGYVPIL